LIIKDYNFRKLLVPVTTYFNLIQVISIIEE